MSAAGILFPKYSRAVFGENTNIKDAFGDAVNDMLATCSLAI